MSKKVGTTFDFEGNGTVTGLATPSGNTDAATKAYVDTAIEGLAPKDSVRVATTANVTLTGPGAAIDGITLANGDRVLVKDQSTAAQNGVYTFTGAATAMTRTPDANTFAELEAAVITVEEGTSNAGTTWRQTAVNGTIDVSSVAFIAFGTAVADASETTAGKIEIATQAETNTGTDDVRAITPLKLKNSTFFTKKFAQDVGDGSATSYNIDHNLGTRDVTVSVHRNSGSYDEVIADVEKTTTNRVVLKFATAPANNAYRIVVVG